MATDPALRLVELRALRTELDGIFMGMDNLMRQIRTIQLEIMALDQRYKDGISRCQLAIAQLVVSKLPPELRNWIYKYVWEWTDARTVQLLNGRIRPHYVCPEYVGFDFASEAASIFYEEYGEYLWFDRAESCSRTPRPDIMHLDQALTYDIFGLGVDPIPHLRKIRIRLSTRDINGSEKERKPMRIAALDPEEEEQDDRVEISGGISDEAVKKIEESLEMLLQFNLQQAFHLCIQIIDIDIAVVEWLLEKLRSIYNHLGEGGIHVTFEVGHVEQDRRDVTDFYELPLQQWRESRQGVKRFFPYTP